MIEQGKRILLAGASGYIGTAVATSLHKAGFQVTALVRDPATAPAECDVIESSTDDQQTLKNAIGSLSFDGVISCIASRSGVAEDAWRVDCQGNRHLLAAAQKAGAQHFVLLSAICVQQPKLAFQRAKLTFEAELKASSLIWSIVRPTAFFKSLSGQVERVRNGKPYLIFGDGALNSCKPISEADLAAYLVSCLTEPHLHNRTLPIGGPGPALTPKQQGLLLHAAFNKPPKFKQVPTAIFNIAAALLKPLGRISPALAAKAELAKIGHYYATHSMLKWDENRECYDAKATPETGTDTLKAHFERLVHNGMAGQEAGQQKLF
ncbi:MAG: NAD(P)H-binding protein [Lysobacterales bacterium]